MTSRPACYDTDSESVLRPLGAKLNMSQDSTPNSRTPNTTSWRETVHNIIFEADTFWGQAFDIVLLLAILLSVATVSLETVADFKVEPWPEILEATEWVLTILFTIEYLARLLCVRKPLRYALSFFGVLDLLACLPMYLVFFGLESQSLMIVRSVRLLRVFRVLKMIRLLKEWHSLQDAFWRARDKIFVFIAVVMVAVTISATLMYQIEHDKPGSKFTSIPEGMYWAIVTMTTVGYGDITPVTVTGKVLSAILILLGYSMIIVPTGFVSAELSMQLKNRDLNARSCPDCLREGHSVDALFCDMCGERLKSGEPLDD